ncbi:hypothetical protein GCM10022220_68070 [Actinocatenispora rupis]|uniref:Uncharacterized protein n=2 Tax=Actinocatenispora rupis TaxID=519421 RepID=A0A8J3JD74_9ACTN|nr:hypothetical protein Aru02nite_70750 [Actinocatenispora rupis]
MAGATVVGQPGPVYRPRMPDEDSVPGKLVLTFTALLMGVGGGLSACLHVSLLLGVPLVVVGCLICVVGVASLVRRVPLGDALARRGKDDSGPA